MTLRCVIVDDSPALLRAAQRLLESEGVEVAGLAVTGDEALRLMLEHQPDVMLVDIDLGRESGFDLIRRLGSEAEICPPSILISTRDETDFGMLIAGSPAIGFLAKADLSATAVRACLARHQDEGRS